MHDALAAEAARFDRRSRRFWLIVLVVVAILGAGALLGYRRLNGYPADHGLEKLTATNAYSPETWECLIEIFERKPIPGTLLGRFEIEPIYSTVYGERPHFSGFRVEAALGSRRFQIGDGHVVYAGRSYASMRDCSSPPFR